MDGHGFPLIVKAGFFFFFQDWTDKIVVRLASFGNFLKQVRVRERGSHPPQKRWWQKSSFCTHCDDGDDDACNLQQQHQQSNTNTKKTSTPKFPLSLFLFSLNTTPPLFPLSLFMTIVYTHKLQAWWWWISVCFHAIVVLTTHESWDLERTTMDKKCGCWAVLRRGVSGACKSSASKDSANSIPRTSLVYDAGIYTYIVLL